MSRAPFDGWQTAPAELSPLLLLLLSAERLQSAVRLLGRIKDSFDQQLVTTTTTEEPESREEGSTTLANEHIISTTDGTAIDDDDNEETDTETETETESSNDGNFIHLRKCQMLDDWGPIGLNCTEEDIVTERVQVVGFLANWLHTYLYIRSEFQLPLRLRSPAFILLLPVASISSFFPRWHVVWLVQLRLSCVTNRSFAHTHTHTHNNNNKLDHSYVTFTKKATKRASVKGQDGTGEYVAWRLSAAEHTHTGSHQGGWGNG